MYGTYNQKKKNDDDYLAHYGIKGMKWGVRRASRKLTKATSDDDRNKAVVKLNRHRSKATTKIVKLQKQRSKLDDDLLKRITKDSLKKSELESKAAELDLKIAKNQKKADGFFTSESKAEKLLDKNQVMQNKANVLRTQAKLLESNYTSAKAKIEANEALTKAFQQGVDDIDDILVKAGYKYING